MIEKNLLLTLAAIGLCSFAQAQTSTDAASHNIVLTVPSVTTVGLQANAGGTGGSDIVMSLSDITATNIGLGLTDVTNNSKQLIYTSIKNANDKTKKIQVKLDANTPDGIALKLHAGAATIAGAQGTLGTSQASSAGAALTLSTTEQTIIDGISSCYTGSSTNSGHQLTYTLSVSDYTAVKAATPTIKVTYTISDNN